MSKRIFSFSIILLAIGITLLGCSKREHTNPLDPNNPNSNAVLLPPPSNLRAVAQPGFISLTWDKVPEAVNYRIYRNNKRFTVVDTTYYHDTGVSAGKTYSYQIASIHSSGLEGHKSKSVSATAYTVDIYFWDDFDDDMVSGHPSEPWEIEENAGSYISISSDIHYGTAGKSCGFFDASQDTEAYAYMCVSVPSIYSGIIEFAWRIENPTDMVGFRTWLDWDWDYLALYVIFRNGELQYSPERGAFRTICSIEPHKWYRMRLEFDCTSSKYDIYVDDTLRVNDASFCGTPSSFTIVQVVAFAKEICKEAYIDDIRLYTIKRSKGCHFHKYVRATSNRAIITSE